MAASTTVADRNAILDTYFNALNGGFMRFADGIRPANADTAISGNQSLADLVFGSPAFAAALSASKAANAITQDTSANATATCTWGTLQISTSANLSAARKTDFSVGTSGQDVNLNSVAISSGAAVSISAFTGTMA